MEHHCQLHEPLLPAHTCPVGATCQPDSLTQSSQLRRRPSTANLRLLGALGYLSTGIHSDSTAKCPLCSFRVVAINSHRGQLRSSAAGPEHRKERQQQHGSAFTGAESVQHCPSSFLPQSTLNGLHWCVCLAYSLECLCALTTVCPSQQTSAPEIFSASPL